MLQYIMLQSYLYCKGEFNIWVTAVLLVTGRERGPLEEGDVRRKSEHLQVAYFLYHDNNYCSCHCLNKCHPE